MRRAVFSVLLGVLGATAPTAASALDPKLTVGPEECARCHNLEFGVWKKTAHAALYDSPEPLHQRPRALEIAGRLGLPLIKTDSPCLECHFTPKASGGRVTARAGVSCESCHGAAANWLTVHNTFEGRRADRLVESSETARRRSEANAAAGMFARGRIYDLYSRCFGCHTVPDEQLVDDGGHTAGGSFDLVARFDAVRHLFVTGARQANAPLPVERRRDLRLLGPLAELEHGLRNLAAARGDGAWKTAQADRVERARKALKRLEKQVAVPLLGQALAASEGFAAADAPRLVQAAEAVARAGRDYFATRERPELAALDREAEREANLELGPEPGAVAEVVADASGGAAADPASPESTGGTAPGAPVAVPGGGGGVRLGATGASGVEGELRKVLRAPATNHPVIDPGRCGGCHGDANRWWSRDPHKRAADPFLDGAPRARQIATAYFGRSNVDLGSGRTVCSNCHATVVTGDEAEEVAAGVSCQSCHGGAGKFFEPHKNSGLGRAQRLALGLVDLQDPATRARNCASCHYVTDRRLLSAGHPPGQGFRLGERLAKIVHWQRSQPDGLALAAAWDGEIARRGPPPAVRVAAGGAPAGDPLSGSISEAARISAATFPVDRVHAGPSTARAALGTGRVATGLPRPPARRSAPALSSWPADAGERPLPELLDLLWERLRRLTEEPPP